MPDSSFHRTFYFRQFRQSRLDELQIPRLFKQNGIHSLGTSIAQYQKAERMMHMSTAAPDVVTRKTAQATKETLTERLKSKLSNPASTPDFDLHGTLNEVLKDVGLTASDSGGKLSFYGQDPIIPSAHRFGAMAAVGLAARSVALAALWKSRTGEGQDIHVDVRKALRRFYGFFEGRWETINGRGPVMVDRNNPFWEIPLFRKTRDGRHVVGINIYPGLLA